MNSVEEEDIWSMILSGITVGRTFFFTSLFITVGAF